MGKKATKYIIILLLVPLLGSLVIAITTDNKGFNYSSSSGYDGIDAPSYQTNNITTEVKRSNTYIYASVFTLVCAGGAVLLFIKNKRGI